MAKFHPPELFDFSRPTEWTEWRQRFLRYRTASKLNEESGEVQVSSIIYSMGREAEKIFASFTFPKVEEGQEDPTANFEIVLEHFNRHFVPRTNVIHERAKFHTRVQEEGETVEQYVRCLHDLSAHCQFHDEDEVIRDRLVLGLTDKEVSQKLQLEPQLTLKTAVDTARHYELVKKQVTDQRGLAINNVHRKWNKQGNPSRQLEKRHRASHNDLCNKCGRKHGPSDCPAKGKICRRCYKRNHFATVCRGGSRVNEIMDKSEQNTNVTKSYNYHLGSVNHPTSNDNTPPWTVTLTIFGRRISFKIDTGADVSILRKSEYDLLSPKPGLQQSSAKLHGPSGPIRYIGEFSCVVSHEEKNASLRVFVISSDTDNLLGRDAAIKLGLVQRLNEVNSVFGEIRTPANCDPVKIVLKDNSEPYSLNTPRRIAIPLLIKVKKELQRMEQNEIIQDIKEPTDWCASMVPVLKKDGVVAGQASQGK